jgi:hypothetical protein
MAEVAEAVRNEIDWRLMEKREDDTPNPPQVIGKPVPPMTLGELMAWHKNDGKLEEFLARIDYSRDR